MFNYAIIGPSKNGKTTTLLKSAFKQRNIPVVVLIPQEIGISYTPSRAHAFLWPYNDRSIPDIALVRGVGSLIPAFIFYRLDWMWILEHEGINLINSRACLEIATNKMLTTQVLTQKRLPNPDTIMCESADLAIQAFYELGEDVVIKPLYGARGRGVFRIQDSNHATLIFRQLEQINEIFYVQRYMEHNNEDFRIFVLGGQVIATMKRKSNNWKTNIARGAIPEYFTPSEEMKEIAIKSAEAVQGEIIGVDLMQTKNGLMVVEVNAVPGYTGLQEVTPFNISDKIIEYLVARGKR